MHGDFYAIVLFSGVDFVIVRVNIDDLEGNNAIFGLIKTVDLNSVCLIIHDTTRNMKICGTLNSKKQHSRARMVVLGGSKRSTDLVTAGS